MKLIMLGSGTSAGVPRIGNDWGQCDPAEPRNRRTRVSIIVENAAGRRILVDTSPDLRHQLLARNIADLDAVIWTHDHADHCHGIDELRGLYHRRRSPLPGYGRAYCMDSLQRRFDYAFTGNRGYPAMVTANYLDDHQAIQGFSVRAVDQPHGPVLSTGLRFEADNISMVYATDFSEVTGEMLQCYADCDLLVVDCLRRDPHPTHAHLDLSLELATQCHARRTVLTHMDKSMDYRTVLATTGDGIEPGFDGLIVEF
ncbi:MAG: MBL fold metallo-hydrolase [Blastomonas sp.]